MNLIERKKEKEGIKLSNNRISLYYISNFILANETTYVGISMYVLYRKPQRDE